MATFEGTHSGNSTATWVSRIRNAVNLFARKERLARGGVCEDSRQGRADPLQSAHVHGKGRRTIIEAVLSYYAVEEGVRCESRGGGEEGPGCARARRGGLQVPLATTATGAMTRQQSGPALPVHTDFMGYDHAPLQRNGKMRSLRFDPAPEALFKAELLKVKRAFVTLHKEDGRVARRKSGMQQSSRPVQIYETISALVT